MYFGELALLRSEPRAATVTAMTDCDLLELGRADFMALLGPLAKTLEAHTARYGLSYRAKKARSGVPSTPEPVLLSGCDAHGTEHSAVECAGILHKSTST